VPGRAGRQLFLFVLPESCIYFFLGLQRVPLGNGPPGVGQHVGPVPQLRARGVAACEDLADGFVLPQLVVVQHRDDHLHFLKEETFFRGVEGAAAVTAPQPLRYPQPWGGSAGCRRDPPRLSPAMAHFGAGSPPCP